MLACFVLDPRLESSSGQRRLQFLGDSLRRLRADLDGRLLVTRGRPDTQIPRIAKEIGATSVHISEDFAPFGTRRDERVRAALGAVPLVATGSPYLVSPGRVTKPDGSRTRCSHRFCGSGTKSAGGPRPHRAPRPRAGSILRACESSPAKSPTPVSRSMSPPARRRRAPSGSPSSTTD